MKTIKENIISELEIKNSRFITLFIKINNPDISNILSDIKVSYPKATHYCYGYIYNDIKRSSDDGEPTGTAGTPILNVLEKENLNNILVVVVRYFGGIKLGAGGLIRAYTKSVTETLKQVNLVELQEGYKLELEFNYTDEKQINYILKDSEILEKEYNENIKYIVLIEKDIIDKLNNYKFNILENIYIEKDS